MNADRAYFVRVNVEALVQGAEKKIERMAKEITKLLDAKRNRPRGRFSDAS